ncbi:MAG: serine/threonine protein kinase [Planctomycetaceae bacterium]|nr:serine/threonine protein kinase [Planctomycetaceae bacterium]
MLDFLEPCDVPGRLGRLGTYEVIDVIGRGGMGVVLRAHDSKLNRVVAVKVLSPEFALNPTARKRFLREAKAGAAVSHPHVVSIHAVEEAATTPYLVMEYIHGQSLQEKIERIGALPVEEILRIGSQIAGGLAAAHGQGLPVQPPIATRTRCRRAQSLSPAKSKSSSSRAALPTAMRKRTKPKRKPSGWGCRRPSCRCRPTAARSTCVR